MQNMRIGTPGIPRPFLGNCMNKLFPFQQEGVSHLLARKRAYLADEMG